MVYKSGQMERKSGFKECPRCGLRNKPSTAQCDFCGWEFKDVSDEWISHIQVLEKLDRETESIVLDDEVSKRIESTIVRSSREIAPPKLEPRPAPPVAVREIPTEAKEWAKGREWAMDRTTQPQIPTNEVKEVKAFVDTMIGEPVVAEAAAVVTVQSSDLANIQVGLGIPVTRTERKEISINRYPVILIAAGALVYVATLIIYSLAMLSVMLGWAFAIVGAGLITIGASFIYDQRMASKGINEPVIGQMSMAGEEVVICPRCHEEVNEADDRCPSCGAAFTR